MVDVYAGLAFWLCDSVVTVPWIVCGTLAAEAAFREPHAVVIVAL